MISITKASSSNIELVARLGERTFLESHGHSGPVNDIKAYVDQKYSVEEIRAELEDTTNICHIIYSDGKEAGFSKILLNTPHPNIGFGNVTKLERIYLLNKYHKLKLGSQLLEFNIELSRSLGQAGMWLFVWKENPTAIRFYTKHNFKIIGSYDFPISKTHSNPNHQMFLKY